MSYKDPTLNLYNPAAQDPEQLLADFIDRKSLLEKILAIVRANTPDRPQQHLVLIGPRGMGKTTLLCAIKHTIERDEALNAEWLPLLFQEEQYGIGDLADFWLEALRHLQKNNQTADRLLSEDADNLAELAKQAFLDLLAEKGKRAILLIDNLNDIFANIGDDHALHSLRALWMTDPRIMVIGAAPSYFAEITEVDQVFHDFFRTFSLERLTQSELEGFLRRYAENQHDDAVLNVIANAPERVAALRILTGGNPRLVKLGYRILRDGLDGDLRHDLERMIDETTPFFKHRIDSLAKEARRTFDAIARRWDPITVDDIRRELRKPSNSVSVQIKRLIDEGFIEEAAGHAKKKSYQVSERFYNIYYLMRHSREGRKRLRWLVGFMQTFYTKKDFKDWAKRLETDLSAPLSDGMRAEKLAHLHALSEAADDDGRAEVFEAIVRDAIAKNDRTALDEETADGNQIEKHGSRYLYAEVVWLLPVEIRRALGFKPISGNFEDKLRKALAENQLITQAEARLTELGAFNQETAKKARAIGVILAGLFDRQQEAEAAFRKAIALDPEYVYIWNNLGGALGNQNRHEEAEAAFRKAIALDPEYVDAWNNLGIALGNQSRYEEAEAAFRKAIALNTEYVDAWNNLGSALNGQNRYEEAEAAFSKAIEVDSNYHYAWSNLAGMYLFDLKRTEAGIAALAQGLSLNPDYGYGRYVLKNFWQPALPTFAQHIANNQDCADNLRTAMTDVLLVQASKGKGAAVLAALQALDETAQQPFEPLLLALQAQIDRSILYRIAREKRDVVLDVMARIDGASKQE
ncbi:MAG: hypothetical protein CTY16_19290 [Methylobacter sp.]|nr:MAG: hypothetical protein CTY16_19290 [Methylobacter sp.]